MLTPIGHLHAFICQTPGLSPDLQGSPILREILLLLHAHQDENPLNNQRIAAALRISASLTSQKMWTLSKGGLVASAIKEDDRRERIAVLSECGRTQAQIIRNREEQFIAALASSTGWDNLRANSFLKSLREYSMYLENANLPADPAQHYS